MDGEKKVLSNGNSIIVRTNFFSNRPDALNSSFNWYLDNLINNSSITGFRDVFFNPVSVSFLAVQIDDLLKMDYCGIVNISCNEVVSKLQFAKEISSIMGFSKALIIEGSITEAKNLVQRSNYLALDNSKVLEHNGRQVPSLYEMIRDEISKYY
jgi:dTDP-4-dehydrorhamnose reductase